MRKYTFNYKQLKEGEPSRPLAKVTIFYKGKAQPLICIIDSGADYTTIPQAIGIDLGINFKQLRLRPKPTVCACGNERAHYHYAIDMEICNETFPVMVSWCPDEITPLLGRDVIFDKFEIIFKKGQKKVIFIKE